MPPLSDQPAPGPRVSGRKNTLFCPGCSHASPTDGDWRVRTTGSRTVYACPVCGARVTTRPARRPHSFPHVQSASADGVGAVWAVGMGWSTWRCARLPGVAGAVRRF